MIKWEDITENMEMPSITKEPITQVQLIRYAGASGDFNQIHTVPDYAKEAGLDGTIAHGMLVMGMMGQMISSFAGVKNVKRYAASFKNITKPGTVLICKGLVKRKIENGSEKTAECKVWVEDSAGDVKLEGKVSLSF